MLIDLPLFIGNYCFLGSGVVTHNDGSRGVGFSSVYPQDICKTDVARITKLGI